jgi:hypothetical protein
MATKIGTAPSGFTIESNDVKDRTANPSQSDIM